MTLSVVYVAETGHVVGALSLSGASPATDVAPLAGDGMSLRVAPVAGGTAVLAMAGRRLAAAAMDDEPGVFGAPLAFGVEPAADGTPKSALERLAPYAVPLVLTSSQLTVTVPAPVTRLTPVFALISDSGPETHVVTGEIPVGGTSAQLQVALTAAGEYGALVLVAGYAGRLEKVTAT